MERKQSQRTRSPACWGIRKLVRLEIRPREGYLDYIKSAGREGLCAVFRARISIGDNPPPRRISRTFPLRYDRRYALYIDSDGDVSRCHVKFVTCVKKAGWPGH
jgi:hypothetical protein